MNTYTRCILACLTYLLLAISPVFAEEIYTKHSHEPHAALGVAPGLIITAWTDGKLRILEDGKALHIVSIDTSMSLEHMISVNSQGWILIEAQTRYTTSGSRWYVFDLKEGRVISQWDETEGPGSGSVSGVWFEKTMQFVWIGSSGALHARTFKPDGSSEALVLDQYEALNAGWLLPLEDGSKFRTNFEQYTLPIKRLTNTKEDNIMVFTVEPTSGMAEVALPISGSLGMEDWLVQLNPKNGSILRKITKLENRGGYFYTSGNGQEVWYRDTNWSITTFESKKAKAVAKDYSTLSPQENLLALLPDYDGSHTIALYRYGNGPEVRVFDKAGVEKDHISLSDEIIRQRLLELTQNWRIYLIILIGLLLLGRIIAFRKHWKKAPWNGETSKVFALLSTLVLTAWTVYAVPLFTGAELGFAGLSFTLLGAYLIMAVGARPVDSAVKETLLVLAGSIAAYYALNWLFLQIPRSDLTVSVSSTVRWSSGRAVVDEGSGLYLYPVYMARIGSLALAIDSILVLVAGYLQKSRR